jgi:hypothetical protein
MPETNKDFSRIIKTEKSDGNVVYEFEGIGDYREIKSSGEIVEEQKTIKSDNRLLRITENYENTSIPGYGSKVVTYLDGDKEIVLSNTVTQNDGYLVTYYNDSLDPSKSIVKTKELGYILNNTEGLSVMYTDKNGNVLTGTEYALKQDISKQGDRLQILLNGMLNTTGTIK